MAPIQTYVFVDLGTTGLLDTDPLITKMSMIAVRRESFQNIQGQSVDIQCERYCVRNFQDELVGFLGNLAKPICLIVHNGLRFDYLLLKSKLKIEDFLKDIKCADSMDAFYDILEPGNRKTSKAERLAGEYPWPSNCYDRDSYCLPAVFTKVLEGAGIAVSNAETRNTAVVKIATALASQFVAWVDDNHYPYDEVPVFERIRNN